MTVSISQLFMAGYVPGDVLTIALMVYCARKMIPFYFTMGVALLILTCFPQSFMWLPGMLYR